MSRQGREAGRSLFLASKICAIIGVIPLGVALALNALGVVKLGNGVGVGILSYLLWLAAGVLFIAALLCDLS